MDIARTAELTLRLQHRHSDGSWSPLEPRSPHDAAVARSRARLGGRHDLRLQGVRGGGPRRAGLADPQSEPA